MGKSNVAGCPRTALYGFAEHPDVPRALAPLTGRVPNFNPITVLYFLSRQTLVPSRNPAWRSGARSCLPRWYAIPKRRCLSSNCLLSASSNWAARSKFERKRHSPSIKEPGEAFRQNGTCWPYWVGQGDAGHSDRYRTPQNAELLDDAKYMRGGAMASIPAGSEGLGLFARLDEGMVSQRKSSGRRCAGRTQDPGLHSISGKPQSCSPCHREPCPQNRRPAESHNVHPVAAPLGSCMPLG